MFMLSFVFLLMGLVSYPELIANLMSNESSDFSSVEFAAAMGDGKWPWPALLEGSLIASTVGSRSLPFDLRAAGTTTVGTTICFALFLLFLRVFNFLRGMPHAL